MPYTYLGPLDHTALTGNRNIDASLYRLKKFSGWDYRVGHRWVHTGMLWWKKRFQIFSVYVPVEDTKAGGEFGVNDFNTKMMFSAPEHIALAYLEGLYWGSTDERVRGQKMEGLLMSQSTQRLQELRRLEGVIAELQDKAPQ